MALVQKGNKQLTVADEAVPAYLAKGFSEIDEKGKVKKKATGGYTPTIADIAVKDEEIAKLNTEIEKLKDALEKAKAKK